jgi:hypothetical protein
MIPSIANNHSDSSSQLAISGKHLVKLGTLVIGATVGIILSCMLLSTMVILPYPNSQLVFKKKTEPFFYAHCTETFCSVSLQMARISVTDDPIEQVYAWYKHRHWTFEGDGLYVSFGFWTPEWGPDIPIVYGVDLSRFEDLTPFLVIMSFSAKLDT